MKLVTFQVNALHLFIAYFAPGGVFAPIQSAGDFQSLGGGRRGDEIDDCFVIPQWLPAPIGRDKGKQPVLDLVPFAGAGRKVTHRNAQCGLIGEFLQLQLPQPQSPPVTATAVGSNQDRFCVRINASALSAPPAPNGGHRKGTGVMVGSHVDKTGVASNVINAIGIGAGNLRTGKIVTLNRPGLLCRTPLLAGIVVVANEFLLFRVDRNDRDTLPQASFDRDVDVAKLRVAIGVIRSLLGLAVTLQAIVQVMKNLCHLHVADGMLLLTQFLGNGPRTFANPAQRRLWVSARLLINQPFERLHQTRIGLGDRFAARSGTTDTADQRLAPCLDFANPFADRLTRQATRAPHHGDPSIAQTHRFSGSHDPPRAFVQMRPCGTKLPLQFGQPVHMRKAYTDTPLIDTFTYLQRLRTDTSPFEFDTDVTAKRTATRINIRVDDINQDFGRLPVRLFDGGYPLTGYSPERMFDQVLQRKVVGKKLQRRQLPYEKPKDGVRVLLIDVTRLTFLTDEAQYPCYRKSFLDSIERHLLNRIGPERRVDLVMFAKMRLDPEIIFCCACGPDGESEMAAFVGDDRKLKVGRRSGEFVVAGQGF